MENAETATYSAACDVQGSYLLAHPEAYDAMFWKSLPNGTFWPMFVVATMAAIIASQALISAVFQIVSQAIVQGFFPRFHVYHTSREVGQPTWGHCFCVNTRVLAAFKMDSEFSTEAGLKCFLLGVLLARPQPLEQPVTR